MTGVPAAMDSIITSPKGSGLSLGNRVARGAGVEPGFLRLLVDLSDELDTLAELGGATFSLEVLLVEGIDLGGRA